LGRHHRRPDQASRGTPKGYATTGGDRRCRRSIGRVSPSLRWSAARRGSRSAAAK
jgi:hypothetical protein